MNGPAGCLLSSECGQPMVAGLPKRSSGSHVPRGPLMETEAGLADSPNGLAIDSMELFPLGFC